MHVPHRRATWTDAALYGASGAFAAGVALFDRIPLYREWGWLALGVYAAGAAAAWVVARRAPRPRPRVWLAAAVFAGVALLPLALEVTWRAHSGAGFHAQSEVLVTEEAAKALVHRRDPYGAVFLHGSLAARPLSTKTHFPYLPAMLLFGLARAVASGTAPVTDARIWFALGALLASALALSQPRLSGDRPVRVAQVLFVLPTGALLMATGGDDLPVLALMLLALVLLDEAKPAWSGLAAGLAAAMKQTAWPLLVFMALAVRGRQRSRFAASALIVTAAVVVPFVAWGPGAFVEDVLRFPFGLGREHSAAGTTTVGSLLLRVFPGERSLVIGVVALAMAAFGLWLAFSGPGRSAAGAARNTGWLLAAAVVLAPSARIGYLVYPVNLLVWSRALRTRDGRSAEPRVAPATAGPAR